MTWIKLNDNVPRHPKIAGLSDRAFRGWINGLCYASEFLTDGVLPDVFLRTVRPAVQHELIGRGLWVCTGGTTKVHDYLKHQSSKASVERERRRYRDRRTGEKPRPEYRDQSTEVHPQTPSDEGAPIRVRREHRDQARAILKARLGYCQHDPQCLNQVICLDLIAHELAQKAKAS